MPCQKNFFSKECANGVHSIKTACRRKCYKLTPLTLKLIVFFCFQIKVKSKPLSFICSYRVVRSSLCEGPFSSSISDILQVVGKHPIHLNWNSKMKDEMFCSIIFSTLIFLYYAMHMPDTVQTGSEKPLSSILTCGWEALFRRRLSPNRLGGLYNYKKKSVKYLVLILIKYILFTYH